MNVSSTLVSALKDFLVHDNDEKIDKIKNYVELIQQWQKHTNIIGKNENILERHIKDCAWIVPHIKTWIKEDTTIADLGSGAGLPGVILAILLDRKITLIESKEKKCRFLEEVQQLDIPIEIVCSRIEEVKNTYHILTARALAPLDKLIKLSRPLLKNDGVCCFQKGKNIQEEIDHIIAHTHGDKKNDILNYQKISSPLPEGGCLLVLRGIDIKGTHQKTR